jgi:ketoreductase RED2
MAERCWADRVVLVTGSSSGIGEAVARRFDELGAAVVVSSSTSVDAGEAVAASLSRGSYLRADIADDSQVELLVSRLLNEHGRLDCLVNNAGTTAVIPHRDLEAAGRDVWRRIFEVNVFGTWSLSVACVPALRANAGSIVNVSSLAGIRPTGSSIPYAASKAALNHQTVLLARVLGPEVRVNAVAPGLIDTPWTADWEAQRDAVRARAPMRRTGSPDDVADVVVDLASSSYVTGQVIAVDGGLSLSI